MVLQTIKGPLRTYATASPLNVDSVFLNCIDFLFSPLDSQPPLSSFTTHIPNPDSSKYTCTHAITALFETTSRGKRWPPLRCAVPLQAGQRQRQPPPHPICKLRDANFRVIFPTSSRLGRESGVRGQRRMHLTHSLGAVGHGLV